MSGGGDWERRVERLWASIDECSEDDFLAAMAELVAERPGDDAAARFQQASAFDSTGHPDRAVPCPHADAEPHHARARFHQPAGPQPQQNHQS